MFRSICFACLVVLAACGRNASEPRKVESLALPTVVVIGDRTLTRDHFARKAQVESVYLNRPVTEAETAPQLIETALMEAALARRGIVIPEAMLEVEEARVDRETRDPLRLAQIKGVFGGDRARYREEFLKPILVNQRFYDVLASSDEVQGERRSAARALHQAAIREPARFKELVAQAGGEYVAQTQKPEERCTPAERARYRDVPGLDGPLVIGCLSSAPVGSICPAVIEERQLLKVVRLVARRDREYDVEIGVIRKRSFEQWFPLELKEIPVRWRDEAVRQAIASAPGPIGAAATVAREGGRR